MNVSPRPDTAGTFPVLQQRVLVIGRVFDTTGMPEHFDAF